MTFKWRIICYFNFFESSLFFSPCSQIKMRRLSLYIFICLALIFYILLWSIFGVNWVRVVVLKYALKFTLCGTWRMFFRYFWLRFLETSRWARVNTVRILVFFVAPHHYVNLHWYHFYIYFRFSLLCFQSFVVVVFVVLLKTYWTEILPKVWVCFK